MPLLFKSRALGPLDWIITGGGGGRCGEGEGGELAEKQQVTLSNYFCRGAD